MIRYVMLVGVLALASVGCANRIRFPLNRMISPESVGGIYNTELELGRQEQVNGRLDISQDEPFPLKFNQVSATSYFGALSFMDGVDAYWSHTGGASSMFGGRFQFMGNTLQAGGSGNSMAFTMAFGGNDHETDDKHPLEFKLGAWDISLIHGYWITPWLQVFETLAYARDSVEGRLHGPGGGTVSDTARQRTLAVGAALYFKPVKLKAEAAHSQLDWSESGSKAYTSLGLTLGCNF